MRRGPREWHALNKIKKVKDSTASSKKNTARKVDVKRLVAVVIGAVVVIYFSCTIISQQSLINKKNKEIQNLEEQISQANEDADKLKNEIDNLQNPEYIEKVAREKLGLVRPNERVFVDSNKSNENNGK